MEEDADAPFNQTKRSRIQHEEFTQEQVQLSRARSPSRSPSHPVTHTLTLNLNLARRP